MNRYILLLFCLLIMGMFTSCYDDQGNYDYNWVENVILRNELKDTVVARGKVLTLRPELCRISVHENGDTVEINPEDYTYEWYTYNKETEKRVVLGTHSFLEDTINLPLADNYKVTFSITEKRTGLSWLKQFNLNVIGAYKEGFFFLTEDHAGNAEVELYCEDATGQKIHETGILARSGFPYVGGGANALSYISWSSIGVRQLWVATGEATGYLDLPALSWKETNMASFLMIDMKPVSYTFRSISSYGVNSKNNFFVTAAGELQSYDPTSAFYSDCAYENGKKFKASAMIGINNNNAMVYNEDNKTLYGYSFFAMTPKPTVSRLAGDEALEGNELLYMQGLANNMIVTLMKGKDGIVRKYYFTSQLDMSIFDMALRLNGTPQELKNNAGLMENAGHILLDRDNGYIYFAVGNKLYNYREGGGVDACVELDGLIWEGANIAWDEITCMAVLVNKAYGKDLIVATYSEANKGRVYVLRPDPSESRKLEVREVIPTDGKVKSITYYN